MLRPRRDGDDQIQRSAGRWANDKMMLTDSKFGCCLVVLFSLSLARAAVEHPSSDAAEAALPEAWFWGDVAGESFLTRVQNEHAPR